MIIDISKNLKYYTKNIYDFNKKNASFFKIRKNIILGIVCKGLEKQKWILVLLIYPSISQNFDMELKSTKTIINLSIEARNYYSNDENNKNKIGKFVLDMTIYFEDGDNIIILKSVIIKNFTVELEDFDRYIKIGLSVISYFVDCVQKFKLNKNNEELYKTKSYKYFENYLGTNFS